MTVLRRRLAKPSCLFSAREGESVFARGNCMGGERADLAVLNFNAPAPDDSAAGVGAILHSHAVKPGRAKADGSLVKRSDYIRLAAFAEKNSLLVPEDVWTAGMYGAGIDEGRAIGASQLDALQGHWHATSTANTDGPNSPDTHQIA